MSQPQGTSIWGNINSCIEIDLDIYAIVAVDHNGEEHKGTMVHKDTADNALSPEAVALGKEDGEWLCYDEKNLDIPLYEVLKNRVQACNKMQTEALQQMEEIQRNGQINMATYFDDCTPPQQTQNGSIFQANEIRNGIYFTEDAKGLQFAVHQSVADHYLTPLATEYSRIQDDYLYFDLTAAAVPINELRRLFEEVDGIVVSEESLYATINNHYQAYQTVYNNIVPKELVIPIVTDAPENLFLAAQLEETQVQQSTSAEDIQEVESEEDFQERVQYTFDR